MQIHNFKAAGIDVGSRFHMVAVNQDRDQVKKFGVYTGDHQKMIAWLKENQVASVAMESTGSYWQTLFDALQKEGFEVILVNGNQIKNVKGKKTDVLDCIWIQKLHSLGLLKGSFLPGYELQKLRTYYNHRQYIISQISKYINKMQKTLRLMNLRLEVVLNDIMGQSGRAIIEAILAGETDSLKLASLANYRVKKSKDEIALALQGNYRDDLLFELRSCLSIHDHYNNSLKECDKELEHKIKELLSAQVGNEKDFEDIKPAVKQRSKNAPDFNIALLASKYFGTDLMQVPGISYNTVLCLLTCMGNDIYKFSSGKQFCSWLRLAPNNKITGGKVVSSRTPKGKNRIALALRQAANSIGNQKTGELNTFFKRIAYRKDRASAVTATARKLALIIYNMLTKKQQYIARPEQFLSNKAKNRIIKSIKSSLEKLSLSEDQLKTIFITS